MTTYPSDGSAVYSRLVDEVGELETCTDINKLIRQILDRYGLEHGSYIAFGMPDTSGPLIHLTYPDDWIFHYRGNGYLKHDSVIWNGLNSLLPIDWSDAARAAPIGQRIIGEAQSFGVGRHGLTLPIRGRLGERGLFSLTSNGSEAEWRQARRYFMRDFQILAYHVHRLVLAGRQGERPPRILAQRELECLTWAAHGKTAMEIALILSINVRTVRYYLESSRVKLGTLNTTNAVAKALTMGLVTYSL